MDAVNTNIISLDDHYFTPEILETPVPQEYLKAVDNLTINDENRLRIKLDEMTKEKDKIETTELRHREEIVTIHQQMARIMLMVRENPNLANIKPEALAGKTVITSGAPLS